MQPNNPIWLFPLIIVAGVLQAWGPPMNGALQKTMANPWLASLISFLPIVALLSVLLLCIPAHLPNRAALSSMPWWAPLGGLAGAGAVIAGLMFVNRVGAGTFAGLTITANLFMSLLIDRFGWLGITAHPLSIGRIAGLVLMATGIALISKY